jgi:hypothetical protein
MRIARPRRPDIAFKRKRGPPPQATKLLRYSMIAGIVFMVLLAIVFIPRGLVNQPPLATPVEMRYNTTRVDVVSVGTALELSRFRAEFLQDGAIIAGLGPPLAGANGSFAFTDADTDGHLGPGDYFSFSAESTGCYRLDVIQIEAGSTHIVGRETWGGCPAT